MNLKLFDGSTIVQNILEESSIRKENSFNVVEKKLCCVKFQSCFCLPCLRQELFVNFLTVRTTLTKLCSPNICIWDRVCILCSTTSQPCITRKATKLIKSSFLVKCLEGASGLKHHLAASLFHVCRARVTSIQTIRYSAKLYWGELNCSFFSQMIIISKVRQVLLKNSHEANVLDNYSRCWASVVDSISDQNQLESSVLRCFSWLRISGFPFVDMHKGLGHDVTLY